MLEGRQRHQAWSLLLPKEGVRVHSGSFVNMPPRSDEQSEYACRGQPTYALCSARLEVL